MKNGEHADLTTYSLLKDEASSGAQSMPLHLADRDKHADGRHTYQAIFYMQGDEASSSAWSVPATVGRCHNQIYTEGTSQIVDGVLDVSFQLPKTKGDSVVKEVRSALLSLGCL